MYRHKKTHTNGELIAGFSLVEVLVFIAILSIFFVIAASVVTISLRNLKINEHKIRAAQYTDELREWLVGEKEDSWGGEIYSATDPVDSFTEKVTQSTGGVSTRTYICANGNLTTWASVGTPVRTLKTDTQNPVDSVSLTVPTCATYSLGTGTSDPIRFMRWAQFDSQVSSIPTIISAVTVTVTTQWVESNQLHKSQSKVVLSGR